MSLPLLEKRRLRVSKGVLPSPYISNLASCHPFTKQIDIVFPSDDALLDALKAVETTYTKGKTSLLELYEKSEEFVVDGGSRLLVLSNDPFGEDCWCIDERAVLTLCVGKDTYERVGVVGRRLPFKGFEDRHVIEVGLRKSAHTPAQQARFREAFSVLDVLRREALGRDNLNADWDVLYCVLDPFITLPETLLFRERGVVKIGARCREVHNVHIPSSVLCREDLESKMEVDQVQGEDGEEAETQARRVDSFFEWVGMACLGSQRLHANDSVNPYVALYDSPEPSYVGSLTHLRWTGLLSPKLIEQIMHRITASTSPNFVSVTSLAYTQSPVSYITGPKTGPSATMTKVPLKLPRKDGEDTWSLVIERDVNQDAQRDTATEQSKWCLVECIGQWDTRWG